MQNCAHVSKHQIQCAGGLSASEYRGYDDRMGLGLNGVLLPIMAFGFVSRSSGAHKAIKFGRHSAGFSWVAEFQQRQRSARKIAGDHVRGGNMADTCSEFFSGLQESIDPEKVKGINATYQWDITGGGGGKWYVTLDDDSVEVTEGEAEDPSITLTVEAQDWLDIINGKLNGQMAFMTGKLKIQGDMTLAMKLQSITG